jgi:hypothetical protein
MFTFTFFDFPLEQNLNLPPYAQMRFSCFPIGRLLFAVVEMHGLIRLQPRACMPSRLFLLRLRFIYSMVPFVIWFELGF